MLLDQLKLHMEQQSIQRRISMQLGPLALEKLKSYKMLALKQGFQSAVLDQYKTRMLNIKEKNKKPDYSKMTTRELLACQDEGANDQLRHLLQRKRTSARDMQRDLKAMDIDMEETDQDKQKDNTDGEAAQYSEEPDPESKREEAARMIQRRLDALTSKKWSFVIDDEKKSGGYLD